MGAVAWRADHRSHLALLVCACVSVGVQAGSTDPTSFLRYFSVWCALLSGLAAAAALAGCARTAVAWVRDASCVGSMLAGAVYVGILLPTERLGTAGGGLTWAPPLLLHVTLPALALVDATRARRAAPPGRAVVLSWTLLPATYLALTLVLHAARGIAPAYAFLDVTRVGPFGVLAVVLVGVGLHLLMTDQLVRRLRARPPAPHAPTTTLVSGGVREESRDTMSGCDRCTAQDTSCETITVAAVDDHPLVLDGISAHLEKNVPCLRLTVIAATVDELLADPPADVVLLDVRLQDGTTVEENVRRICATGSRVVLFTTEHRTAVIVRAMEAGAAGLILKEDDPAHLVTAVREVHEGRNYVSSDLAEHLVANRAGAVRFTPRELEVLQLRATGLPWAAVAKHLGITPATVHDHVKNALAKYQAAVGRVDGPADLVARVVADGHVDGPVHDPRTRRRSS